MSPPPRGMRAPVERIWREGAPNGVPERLTAAALAPLSWTWSAVTAARNAYYDRFGGSAVEGITVVSIGNLVVGGTGKTPMVAHVVGRLRALGARPAVVLRGYGRDEVLLHRRWNPDIPVVEDAVRTRGVETARTLGSEVAVLDDGFQHRKLARDLDLVLLAAEDPFPGHALPRGRYREPARALERADAVILTRRVADAGRAGAVADAVRARCATPLLGCAHLRAGRWLDLSGRRAAPPPGPVLVVTGVARPDQVVRTVADALPPGTEVEAEVFADHHDYTIGEVEQLVARSAGRTLVVTEKDAVKLEALMLADVPVRVVGSEIAWDWGEDAFAATLAGAVPARSR